jgi:hypothetical protein
LIVLSGCAGTADDNTNTGDSDFSSNQATLLDFELDANLTTDFSFSDKQTITDQLLFTIGHLNGDRAVGRLDAMVLSNVQHSTTADGKTAISYHVKLPVAWGSKTNLPTTYEFKLPVDVSQAGQKAFMDAHKDACVDPEAHDLEVGSMWYYYRPASSGCTFSDAEIVKTTAKVTPSPLNTTAKYPEYQEVWKDNRLEVVAIFGKFAVGGTQGDAGVEGFNNFVSLTKRTLAADKLKTTPANVADRPAPATLDVTFEGTLPDGKQVKVTALLVDSITNVWPGFQQRYESLTETADMIAYNGHSGLGQNVRALAKMGKWAPEKYQIFFMNGCDSFSYVDGSLAQTRAALNHDDPTGTKYMEFVTNAMPSFFASMPAASTAIMTSLLDFQHPKTYEDMFKGIDRAEVVLVTGEEDNVFQPGMKIGQ